jgi:hypothetical protein
MLTALWRLLTISAAILLRPGGTYRELKTQGRFVASRAFRHIFFAGSRCLGSLTLFDQFFQILLIVLDSWGRSGS